MRLMLAMLMVAPLPVLAESWTCRTQGYCTNALECSPDTSQFNVVLQKDGSATFGWDGDVTFSAMGERMTGFTVFRSATGTEAIQTLVWTGTGEATFGISAILPEWGLYTSFHALTCERT